VIVNYILKQSEKRIMAYFELLTENFLGGIYENSSSRNSLYISVAPWFKPFRSRVIASVTK
jgi:hypothetical protein